MTKLADDLVQLITTNPRAFDILTRKFAHSLCIVYCGSGIHGNVIAIKWPLLAIFRTHGLFKLHKGEERSCIRAGGLKVRLDTLFIMHVY